MNNYHGPKLRLSRRLGAPVSETAKHAEVIEKRGRPMSGGKGRRRQRSLYGRQLDEKQKMNLYYNIGNKQLGRYLAIAKKNKASTTDVMMETVESRLDNVLRRLGWGRTIWQARQIVAHGHILVNGRRVDRPGYLVSPNDVIAPRESSKEFVKAAAGATENTHVPGWLVVDPAKFEAQVVRKPKVEDIQLPFDLDCSMIIEFFSK